MGFLRLGRNERVRFTGIVNSIDNYDPTIGRPDMSAERVKHATQTGRMLCTLECTLPRRLPSFGISSQVAAGTTRCSIRSGRFVGWSQRLRRRLGKRPSASEEWEMPVCRGVVGTAAFLRQNAPPKFTQKARN